MNLQILHDLLRRRPFEPFRLVMSSGEKYEVPSRDLAFLTQSENLVATEVGDDGIPDSFKMRSLLHVTAIEPLEPSSAT